MSKKGCELCSNPARMFCESDQARFCWDYDEKVHAANFLVAKHTRTLLCHVCHRKTPWKAAGPKLGPTISFFQACADNGENSCGASSSRREDEDGDDSQESMSEREKSQLSITEQSLSEDGAGGTIFTFQGTRKNSNLRVSLRIHTPQFYWKVATEGDLGFADAYINGDFSFVDKNQGLLNLFMIFIASTELYTGTSKKRGWWTPLLFTSVIASAKYFFKHVSRRNTLTQAQRNISRHYDLSNELFSLFLDETMTYSCPIFQDSDQDLKNAQLRKLHTLIEKAKVSKEHHVLDIGCGWGSLAIELVKRTGCKCTGITLSENQLEYAQLKVKEAGLQDQIRFLLCDYRQLPEGCKYDRIISCGMVEAVGNEYMEEYFKCCDSALAENGLFVLQFISVADEKYDEFRLSQGFIKEYIFPGGCLPSLSRVTSAMATASRLCIVHLEDIGSHYYRTLRCWRENFLQNQGKILDLGFDEKFIRTWEYYFDYCAAGFRSRVLGDYQIVFSRPSYVGASGHDAFKLAPSTE